MRIGIYGSCVSRDTVEARDPGRYRLKMYVARHSLASMDTDASKHLPPDLGVSSAFQRNQIDVDARGALWNRLDAVRPTLDVLLWDLVDERHGFVRLGDGTYLTRSVDLLGRPPLASVLALGQHYAFGSESHYHMWQLAADRFVDGLRRRDLFERTLVLAVPWAEVMTSGEPAPSSMGVRACDANVSYLRYYQHLASLGLAQITVRNPRADAEHRWGAAPFHYEPNVYEALNSGIDSFLQSISRTP